MIKKQGYLSSSNARLPDPWGLPPCYNSQSIHSHDARPRRDRFAQGEQTSSHVHVNKTVSPAHTFRQTSLSNLLAKAELDIMLTVLDDQKCPIGLLFGVGFWNWANLQLSTPPVSARGGKAAESGNGLWMDRNSRFEQKRSVEGYKWIALLLKRDHRFGPSSFSPRLNSKFLVSNWTGQTSFLFVIDEQNLWLFWWEKKTLAPAFAPT